MEQLLLGFVGVWGLGVAVVVIISLLSQRAKRTKPAPDPLVREIRLELTPIGNSGGRVAKCSWYVDGVKTGQVRFSKENPLAFSLTEIPTKDEYEAPEPTLNRDSLLFRSSR
jgi:hypothetical protein